MSEQTHFPRRTPQGVSSRASHGSHLAPSQHPPPQYYQATGPSQTPSRAPLNSLRAVASPFTSTHAQPGVRSEWQQSATSTGVSQVRTSGTSSRHTAVGDYKGDRAGLLSTNVPQDGRKGNGEENRRIEQKGGIRNTDSDDKEGSYSVWERRAARLGGHDGDAGSARRETNPLPRWLREP
ncbi:hypothetical protein GGS24DRAFT_444271 [Hypoxylon argillaceum]|nr:hypothetical protein GGS24DRAFT_444271 [Hypoxylon argillaceum]